MLAFFSPGPAELLILGGLCSVVLVVLVVVLILAGRRTKSEPTVPCPKCGAQIPPQSSFCPQCGQPPA